MFNRSWQRIAAETGYFKESADPQTIDPSGDANRTAGVFDQDVIDRLLIDPLRTQQG